MNDNLPAQHHANPMVQFKRDMEAMASRELEMLDDKAKARMKSAAIVAVTKDPELLLADRQSFMAAIRMCAQHGVTPDGNEATLQVYNTKVKDQWVKKVTYLPMIRGIVNRVLRSGKIKLFYAEVVYTNEAFRLDLSHGDRRPMHEFDPMDRAGDADLKGAYSVAVYDDGTTDCEPMPRSEIEKVKAAAKTKNVWDGWFSEKAKVAVMKRHSKRLPLSAEDMDFILNREESDFDQLPPKDITPEPRQNLAQRLAAAPASAATAPAEVLPPEPEDGPPERPHWTASIDTEQAFPGDLAFKDGAKAFAAAIRYEMNPHHDNPEAAASWAGGWVTAERAKQ